MRRNLFAVVSSIASVVGLLTLTHTALADPPAGAAAAATQASASPQRTARDRKELTRQLKSFVSNVTGPLMSDDPVPLWRTPVCPVLAGLAGDKGEQVFAHLESTLRGLGIPVGGIGCRPNFQVVVTSQPEATIDAMAKTQSDEFGDARHLQSFMNTARPVRIWYSTVLPTATVALSGGGVGAVTGVIGAGGSGAALGTDSTSVASGVAMDSTGTRFSYAAYLPMVSVIAVVDLNQVVGFDWGQIADYVAMGGATQVNLDAKFGDAPTILRLFSATGKDRLAGLSDWDKALLTELYRTDPQARSQRFEVSMRMAHDLAP
jgi:hypothetical protein